MGGVMGAASEHIKDAVDKFVNSRQIGLAATSAATSTANTGRKFGSGIHSNNGLPEGLVDSDAMKPDVHMGGIKSLDGLAAGDVGNGVWGLNGLAGVSTFKGLQNTTGLNTVLGGAKII